MLTIDEKNACFDGDVHPHAHFQCKVCNKIYDVEIPQNLSEAEPFRKEGFIVEEVHQYYKGVCPECAEKGFLERRSEVGFLSSAYEISYNS